MSHAQRLQFRERLLAAPLHTTRAVLRVNRLCAPAPPVLQAAEADVGLLRSRLSAAGEAQEDLRRAKEEVRRLEATLTELAGACDAAGGQ